MKYKRLAICAAMLVLSLALSYGESFITVGLAGVKLGFANAVTVFLLLTEGFYSAASVAVLRCVISGFLFSGPVSIVYSLCGLLLSLPVMFISKKLASGTVALSASGAVFFNIGQLAAARIMTKSPGVWAYLPVLILAGIVCGGVIGLLVCFTKKPLSSYTDTSSLRFFAKSDGLIAIIPAAAVALMLFSQKSGGDKISVTVNGEAYGTYSLSESGEYEIKTSYGVNILKIENGRASVCYADCKGGDCTRGSIGSEGGAIVCLPHRLIIEITEAETDAVAG